MIARAKAGVFCLAAVLGACGSRSLQFPTRGEPPVRAPRKPPGIALEKPFASPGPGGFDERSLVLTPPLEVRDAQALVEQFIEAVRTENSEALDTLFAQGAVQQLTSGREFRNAREYWRHRMARLDYRALADGPVYRLPEMRIQRAADPAPSKAPPGAHPRDAGEVLLTLPLLTTHAGSARLFGPELTFLIVEEEGRLVIARIVEDFQLL